MALTDDNGFNVSMPVAPMGGGSYARGGSRRAMGGRYSRDAGGMAAQMRDMLPNMPDEVTRMDMQRIIDRMEQMSP